MFDVVELTLMMRSKISAASRSLSNPSDTKYGGIGAICMVFYVFVKLDFARWGYLYATPLAVMVAVNCASVITATVFLSTIDDCRHNGCGGPNSWLPYPCKNNNFSSTFVGVAPMGLYPTPTQFTTLTRCVLGTFTRATWTWFPSFSLSIAGAVPSRKLKNADAWLL